MRQKRSVSSAARDLKAIRERAGWSSRALAKEIEMADSTYASYENKFYQQYLPVDLIKKLIPALRPRGIKPEELLALAGVDDDLLAIVDESIKPTDTVELEGAQALVEVLRKVTGKPLSRPQQASALRDGLRYYRKHSGRLGG